MPSAGGAAVASAGAAACVAIVACGVAEVLPRLHTPVREAVAVLRAAANPEEAELQARGCDTVAARCLVDADARDFLVWAGALEQALAAMRGHPGDGAVQQSCSGAVAGLASGHPEAAAEAGRAGAVELLVDAMRASPQENATELRQAADLGLLLARSPENRIRWAAAGGLEVNLEAARRCLEGGGGSAAASLQQLQAWRLFAAGVGEPNEARFEALGGVQLAVRVLRSSGVGHRVRAQVLNAMRAVCSHSDKLRSAATVAGFVEAAVQAAGDAPLDRQQQALACGCFASLAEGDEGHRAVLLKAGAVEAAARAVRASTWMRTPLEGEHGVRYTVYGECFKALESLAASEQARGAILTGVTREDVIGGMRAEPEDWKVQTGGSALLRLFVD